MAFNAMPADARFEQVLSGCEACIIASVGGDFQILSDLRASILGRRKKRLAAPKLLPLIEAWIDWTGRASTIRAESSALGREIRACRRQMQNARRQKRQNVADGVVDGGFESGTATLVDEEVSEEIFDIDGNEKSERAEHDFEGSIIDFYATLMSWTSVIPNKQSLEGIHKAFRDSMVFSPTTGTFHRVAPAPLRQPRNSIYSESNYSSSMIDLPSTRQNSAADLPRHSCENHARAYRRLVGTEKERDAEGQRMQVEGASHERVTQMSNYQ